MDQGVAHVWRSSVPRTATRLGVALASALALAACAAPRAVLPTSTVAPTTPAVRQPTSPPSPAAAPSATAAAATPVPTTPPTAGELARRGAGVFARICATCHGAKGEGVVGPALIGPGASLGKFGSGKGLYDYVSVAMPQSNPGSLSPDEYLQVVAFLLVQNGAVRPDASLTRSSLAAVQLPR